MTKEGEGPLIPPEVADALVSKAARDGKVAGEALSLFSRRLNAFTQEFTKALETVEGIESGAILAGVRTQLGAQAAREERQRIIDLLTAKARWCRESDLPGDAVLSDLIDELRANALQCICIPRYLDTTPESRVIGYERECPVHGEVVKVVEDRDVTWLRRRVESKKDWLPEGVMAWLNSLIRGMEAHDDD